MGKKTAPNPAEIKEPKAGKVPTAQKKTATGVTKPTTETEKGKGRPTKLQQEKILAALAAKQAWSELIPLMQELENESIAAAKKKAEKKEKEKENEVELEDSASQKPKKGEGKKKAPK
jgi:hypothetical protein